MLEIDGSQGEGGGQVLRSALALSIVTGQAIHIYNIRAKRPTPGLMAQHLKSVDAAAAIGVAQVDGATLHSKTISFQPSKIRSGRYKFDIGTAGATTLILQTIFLPLSLASSASSVIITGGTHVAWSPCYHYLALHWLPYMHEMGFDVRLSLDQAGFYPKGGGRISATIRPVRQISPLQLTHRGSIKRIIGVSAIANLPLSIAERQKHQALLRLNEYKWNNSTLDIKIYIENLPSQVKGTFLLLMAEFEGGRCCYFSLGELGKPAERVADEALDGLLNFMETDGAIDPFIADQLLLPLCFAKTKSVIHPCQITQHILTNAAIIRTFIPVHIEIQGEIGSPGSIHIMPM